MDFLKTTKPKKQNQQLMQTNSAKTIAVSAAVIFCVGVIFGWVVSSRSDLSHKFLGSSLDTLIIRDTVVQVERDTIRKKPVIRYKTRIVMDTIQEKDTVYAELVKYKEYKAERTFSDSAYVLHRFGIEPNTMNLDYNNWEYTPPPRHMIARVDTYKVYPSKVEKAVKGVMWMAAGAGITAIINNNRGN